MIQERKLLLPTILALMGIAVLCGLGAWQLDRKEWKDNLVAELEAAFASEAAPFFSEDLDATFDFKRGTLAGEYDFSKQIFIAPRVYKNMPGKHVYTPLRLEDDSYILVNRGWVPVDWQAGNETPEAQKSVQDTARNGALTGLALLPERNDFTPENKPAEEAWYFADADEIAAAKNIPDMHGRIFLLESVETEGDYPIPQGHMPGLPNDHLQYAVFWFTMAGILAIMYVLRFLR